MMLDGNYNDYLRELMSRMNKLVTMQNGDKMTEYIKTSNEWFYFYYCKYCGHKEYTPPNICPRCHKVVKNRYLHEEVYDVKRD